MVLATVNAAKRLSKEEAAGTVLVVEDESLTRAKILRALTRSHFRTLDAGTGEDAMVTRLHFAMADEVKLRGMIRELVFHGREWGGEVRGWQVRV